MSDDTVAEAPADPDSNDPQSPADNPAPTDQPGGKNPSASGHSGKTGAAAGFDTWKIALSEWISALGSAQNPPFYKGATFPDEEWARLLRVFTVSTALAAVITVTGDSVPDLAAKSGVAAPTHAFLSAITLFTCYGAVYSVYSRIFGVRVTARQTLFCFALVLTPWLPVFALLKFYGGGLGITWLVLVWGLALHVVQLTARAISIVSGVSVFRVFLSFLLGASLAILAVVSQTPIEVSTKTTVTASSATAGAPEVFTAKVVSSGGTPTGSVKFLGPNGITYGEAPVGADGVAAFSTIIANAGPYCVQVEYSGDPRDAASTSKILAFDVLDAPTPAASPEPRK